MITQKLLLACLTGVLLAGAAHAVPVVVDPNFSDVDVGKPFGSNGVKFNVPGWTANLNLITPVTSFVGQSQFSVTGYWNNGALPSGTTVAGFLANPGDNMSQAVSGFTVGDTYQISLLANARSGQSGSLVLDISASGSETFQYGLSPVGLTGTSATPFLTEVYSFTAQTGTETITLGDNILSTGGSVVLSGLQIADLTHPAPVSEPISLALLGTGLASLSLLRRRR